MQTDLTTGSIRKHLSRIAIPSVIGSFFMTMYNVVDTFWAGKIGINLFALESFTELFHYRGDIRGLSALSLCFPIFLVMISLSSGMLSGTIALIGNALGRKDKKEASMYLVQAFFYAIAISLLLLLLLPFLGQVFALMQVEDPEVLFYAKSYIQVIIFGNIFFCFGSACGAGLISRGDTKTQRNIYILIFFLNIFLDPLLMFGYGPIPAMGLAGVAYATLIAQALGVVLMLLRLVQYKAFEGMELSCFRPRRAAIVTIAQQSLPMTTSIGLVAFLLGLVNRYAMALGGSEATAAYGASLRVEQIALIPSLGLGTALTSIASQNNGAGRIDRVAQAYRYTLLWGLGLLLSIMVPLGFIFPARVLGIFTADPKTLELGVRYLQVCTFTFYAYMLLTFSGSIFQALKRPMLTTYMTVLRNVILPILTFYIFAYMFDLGVNGVWYAILFNNWLVCILAFIMARVLLGARSRELKAQGELEAQNA